MRRIVLSQRTIRPSIALLVHRSFASVQPLEEKRHDYLHKHTSKTNDHQTSIPFNDNHAVNNDKLHFIEIASEEEFQSPSEIHYTRSSMLPLTSILHIVRPQTEDVPRGIWPVFRLLVSVYGSIVLLCTMILSRFRASIFSEQTLTPFLPSFE